MPFNLLWAKNMVEKLNLHHESKNILNGRTGPHNVIRIHANSKGNYLLQKTRGKELETKIG